MGRDIQVVTDSNGKSIRDLMCVEAITAQFTKVLPKILTPGRFVRVVMSAITRCPKLMACKQESFFMALMTLAECGLEPDGRRAALVPFGKECTAIPMYQGLVETAMRSGFVSNIYADVVCDEDVFDFNKGVVIEHRPALKKPRGKAYCAYCIVRLSDGNELARVMREDEIHAVRDKSSGWKAYKKGWTKDSPWADPQSEPDMWKKTVTRNTLKWVPRSSELQRTLDASDHADFAQLDTVGSVVSQEATAANFEGLLERANEDAGAPIDVPTGVPSEAPAKEPLPNIDKMKEDIKAELSSRLGDEHVASHLKAEYGAGSVNDLGADVVKALHGKLFD